MQESANQIKYPYMPEDRSIVLVSEDNPFMQRALEVRKKSRDQLIPIGIVAVRNGKIIGEETNKPGYLNKTLIDWHKKWMCPRRWFKVKTGTHYWMCPGCAGSANHSESRIIKAIKRAGKMEELRGADVYMAGHWWCCKPCWDKMIEAGIANVYLLEGAKEKFDSRK